MVRSGSAEIALDYMNTALILEKKQRPPDPDHKGDDMVYIIRWRHMTWHMTQEHVLHCLWLATPDLRSLFTIYIVIWWHPYHIDRVATDCLRSNTYS